MFLDIQVTRSDASNIGVVVSVTVFIADGKFGWICKHRGPHTSAIVSSRFMSFTFCDALQ